MKKTALLTFSIILGFITVAWWQYSQAEPAANKIEVEPPALSTYLFLDDGLKTNTAQSSINLDKVLDGGPPKDGIPALTNPEYVDTKKAEDWYNDDSQGLLIELGDEAKWLSFDVLYWHEIVNDTIGKTPVAITFCPLCGSAIVFDRRVEDEVLSFGVSGKLWQSNLLMYDQQTESLWSQIEGQAKIGDRLDQTLKVVNSQLVTWAEVKNIPQLKVLSHDTGFERDYGRNPYGTYESDTELIFPVENLNQDLHPKTIMVAGSYKGIPFALERIPLLQQTKVDLTVGDNSLDVEVERNRITIKNSDGQLIPTFNTMWFSWANHHLTDDAVIWSPTKTDIKSATSVTEQKTKLIEYFSYGCYYCKQIHTPLHKALEQLPNVDLELKHFIVYDEFLPMHEAQVCASEQGLGYEFHDQYFTNHYPSKTQGSLNKIIAALSLNEDQLNDCLNSDRPTQKIQADMFEGSQIGVRGTPTLVVKKPNQALQAFTPRTTKAIVQALK